MHQTLFYIPGQIGGVPVFGWGLLLLLWLIISAVIIVCDVVRSRNWKMALSFTPFVVLVSAVLIWVLPMMVRPAGLAIQSYGFMMVTGVLSGIGLSIWRAKRWGLSGDVIISLALWMCIPGIIGARIFFCIEYWDLMQGETVTQTIVNLLKFTEGGLVVYGSVFGAVMGAIVFFRTTKVDGKPMPVLPMLDLIAPSMVLGLAFGRIGCLLNGCCFGDVCDINQYPWAITFPAGSPPFMQQLEKKQISLDSVFVQGMRLKSRWEEDPATSEMLAVVEVEKVKSGSSAETAGVKPGMILRTINGLEVIGAMPHQKPGPQQGLNPDQVQDRIMGLSYYQLTADARHVGNVSIEFINAPPVEWSYSSEGEVRSLPVHPTQIYSSLNAIMLFLILMVYWPFHKRDGTVFALLFTLYPICRWILEAIRIDESDFASTGMSISQNVSIVVLVAIVFFWAYLLRRPKELYFEPQTEPHFEPQAEHLSDEK